MYISDIKVQFSTDILRNKFLALPTSPDIKIPTTLTTNTVAGKQWLMMYFLTES